MSKKKLLVYTGIIFLFILLYFFMHVDTVKDFPTKEGPIVAFGDSLVEGVGTTEGNTFVAILSERIGEEIINLGVSGNTTADGLMRIRELEAENPRLVILMLGGNDALRRIPPEDTFYNLASLIEALQNNNVAVLLVGAPGGISYAKKYEEGYQKMADTYGLAYVPNILKGLIGRPEYMSDAIHPNDAGHILMADKIEPVLRNLLEGS